MAACKYFYNGQLYTEAEFKSILDNGLIDQLIKDGKINLTQNFTINEDLINRVQETVRVPIELSVTRKIQRGKNLNNGVRTREDENGNIVTEPLKSKPADVLKKSNKKRPGKYNNKLVLGIVDGKGVWVNGVNIKPKTQEEKEILEKSKGTVAYQVLKDLEGSMSSDQFSKFFKQDESIQGTVLMFVDSANGAYPVKLFTNKIEDTNDFKNVKEGLKLLKDPKVSKERKKNIKQFLNRITYMYDTDFVDGKYVITRIVRNPNQENKSIPVIFEKQQDGKYTTNIKNEDGSVDTLSIEDYIGKSIYRVDISKINKTNYNQTLSDIGAITTDLFSVDGNFFHSSNITLSYNIVNPQVDALVKKNLNTNIGGPNSTNAKNTAKSTNDPNVPNEAASTTSKPLEAQGIFDMSIDATINKEDGRAVRYITFPEKKDKDGNIVNKKKTFRVEGTYVSTDFGALEDGFSFEKQFGGSIQLVNINPNKTYSVIGKYELTDAQKNEIKRKFNADKLVKEKTAKIQKEINETLEAEAREQLGGNNVVSDENLVNSTNQEETGSAVDANDALGLFDAVDPREANELGPNDTREKRVSQEKLNEQKTWDKKKELEALKVILGKAFVRKSGKDGTVRVFKNFETLKEYLPAATYKMLLEANKNGSELFGLFTTAAVLIKHNAPAGVAFHEAFHVVFNLALPLQDRIKIMNEAYLKYPQLSEKVLESGKELTWLQLEEFLADEFMEYANSNEQINLGQIFEKKDKKSSLTGIPTYDAYSAASANLKEIPKFFKGLNRMLNVFFKQNRALNIDNLFENINTGVYAKKIQFKNTTLDTSVRQMSRTSSRITSPQRKFNNPLELESALQTLTDNIVFNIIETYRKENNLKDASISDSFIINEIGVHKFLSSILTDVIGQWKGYKQSNNTEMANIYGNLINVLTNDNKALAFTESGKLAITDGLVQFGKSTPLLEAMLADLRAKYNINIAYDFTTKEEKINLTPENAVEGSSLDDFVKEEATSDAVAMKNSIEVNPRETASQVLIRFLGRIPKKNNQGGYAYNMHNQPIFENGRKIFGQLINEISDTYNVGEMIDKIKTINKPWAEYLLAEFTKVDQSDPSNMANQLWLAIANKTKQHFSTIIVKNGQLRRMSTNRNTLNDIIVDKIIAEFLNTDNKLFKTEQGKNWKENINDLEAQKFYARTSDSLAILEKIISRANSTDPATSQTAIDQFNSVSKEKLKINETDPIERKKTKEDFNLLNFKELSSFLQEYNINLTPEQIELIYNPNLKNPINSLRKLQSLLKVVKEIAKKFSGGNSIVTQSRDSKTGVVIEKLQHEFNPEQAVNPFLVKESIKDDNRNRVYASALEALAEQIEPALEVESVVNFQSMDGKTIYALIYSGEIHKMIAQAKNPETLQKILDETPQEKFVSQLPYTKELLTPGSSASRTLDMSILDGLKEERRAKGVVYSRMTDQELFSTMIGMFKNNQTFARKDGPELRGDGYFKLGIASDSPNVHFIKAPKLTKEEIIENFVQTARAEHSKILDINNLVEQSKDLDAKDIPDILKVPNYIKNNTKWQTLSFLNNSEVGRATLKSGFNEVGIRKAIEEFLTEDITIDKGFFNKEIQELKRKGIITNVQDNGTITFADNVMDSQIIPKHATDFLKGYLLNQFYYSTQTNSLFAGDIAFYKNTVDAQKRFKQLFSPGTYTTLQGTMQAVVLNDIEELSTKNTLKAIDSILNKSDLSETEKRLTKEIWKNNAHNITDAATVLSLNRRKEILEGLQEWTPEMEQSLERIKKGEDTLEDFYTLNADPIASPAKQFTYTVRNVTGRRVPLQIKNAEFVPTPAFALQKDGDVYKYPKLAALYLDLNGGKNLKGETVESKFDLAIFESAVKVGAIAKDFSQREDGSFSYEFNSYNEVNGEVQINPDYNLMTLNKEDYRKQQEVPSHFLDDRSNFGTQLRNLIIADLNPEGEYDLGDGDINKSGQETSELFQELVSNDLEREYNKIKDDFLRSDGELNYDTILPLLQEAANDRGYGPSYLEALTPVKDENGNTTSLLPLYHPKIAYQTQSLINSIIRNRVTKQKINGGQLVNFSSFGVSDKLDMIVDEKTGSITLEAIMPWTSAKYFPTDKDGNVDINKLRETEEGRDLLEMVANRIPTEGKYSMFNIRIVDFSPQSMGGQIILPREITTIAGLDFDIDKVFFMMKNFYYKDGKVRLEKFIDKVETEEKVEELAGNIYRSLPAYKRFLDVVGIKGSLRNKKIETYKKEFRKSARRQENSPQGIKAVDSLLKALTQEEEFEFAIDEQFYSEEQNKELENIKRFLSSQDANIIRKLNSKKASDNKKINIIKGILKNRTTSAEILQTGNFRTMELFAAYTRLKQAGKDAEAKLKGDALLKAAEKLDEDTDFNISYPSTQMELFRRNMDGRDLTGIFANHGSHHAKAQHTGLQLKLPIRINKTNYQALNKSKTEDGERISRKLEIKNAAVVDNAKQPLAGFLNINYFTANAVALSDRLGVPEQFTYGLINQPYILKLTRNFTNDTSSFTPSGHINTLKQELRNAIKAATKEDYAKIDAAVEQRLQDLDIATLQQFLKEPESKNVQYLITQLAALKLFETLYDIGQELSNGVQAARVDTQALNPTNSENFTVIQKQRKIVEQKEEDKGAIEGLTQVFIPGESSTQFMIPSFNEYGFLKPISEILEKIFPSIGKYNDQTTRFDWSYLGQLKQTLADEIKSDGLINEKQARLIDTQFINYIATSFPFFKASQSKDIITKTPINLRKIQRDLENPNSKLYKELADNVENIPYGKVFLKFLSELEIKSAEPGIPLDKRIVYYRTGKKAADFQTSEAIWEAMLLSENDTIKQLGLDLVKYSFFTNGYGYGPYSLASLIPVKFWSDSYQATLTDSGVTFNQHIKTILKDLQEKDNSTAQLSVNEERFKKQLIQAFGQSAGLLKNVNASHLGAQTLKDKKITKESTTKEFLRNTKEGRVIDSNKRLLIDTKLNKDFINENTERPLKYLKRFVPSLIDPITNKKGTYRIYELTDVEFLTDTRSILVYSPLSTTSLSNFVLEFDQNNDIESSWLAKPVSKKQSKAATNLDKHSSSVAARKNAEEDAKKNAETTIESTRKSSNLFEEGPKEVKYNLEYREDVAKAGFTEEQWEAFNDKQKKYHIECKGIPYL